MTNKQTKTKFSNMFELDKFISGRVVWHLIQTFIFLIIHVNHVTLSGDEMGMLEDMSIAIRDLSAVKFKVCLADYGAMCKLACKAGIKYKKTQKSSNTKIRILDLS